MNPMTVKSISHTSSSVLDEIGYDGWVGCEYRPAATTSAGPELGAALGCAAAISIPSN